MATTALTAKHGRVHYEATLRMALSADRRSQNRTVWINGLSTTTPAIDNGDAVTYPVQVGDLVLSRYVSTTALYICSVAPVSGSTAATFVAIATNFTAGV
jgi:hypothetical protein